MPEQLNRMEQTLAVPVKLSPVNHSDQPVSANYTTVNIAQGIAYVDFGFIEPTALGALVREAKEGKATQKSLEGKLVVRLAMGLDVLQRLQQQLQQVLVGLRGRNETKEK